MARKPRELRELSIRNVGVIEESTIAFGSGFNVITGETGAGKTMVLTGLSLISGQRADSDLIRQGKDRLVVSLQVAMEDPATGRLKELIDEHDPEVEDGGLLLQRTLSREGRGKALIGSDPCTASVLGEFAQEFFTIHGQSTNHHLINQRYQLSLLDQSNANVPVSLKLFREALNLFREKKAEITALKMALVDRESEIAAINRFIADHVRVKPKTDEWIEIEERIQRLDSVEEFLEVFRETTLALGDENDGAIVRVSSALRSLEKSNNPDRSMTEMIDRLRQALIEIKDVNEEVHSQLEDVEVEPGEIDRLRERRATLKQFIQRYSGEVDEGSDTNKSLNQLTELLPEKERLLKDLDSGDHRLGELESELSLLHASMIDASLHLRSARKDAASLLERSVNAELQELGLAGARFVVHFEELSNDQISNDGADLIEFLFSAHPNGALLPLHKGISGGELSRVMLAIELALVESREVGTLIFDEIDAGIGGEIGLVIGERISRLAKRYQVLVITHLAQVAVWANNHFRIEKSSGGSFVLSSVQEVEGEERISEIARMLSGQSDLPAARTHAIELLKHAGK